MDGEAGRLQFMGSQRVGHNWTTSLYLSIYIYIYISKQSDDSVGGIQGKAKVRNHGKKFKGNMMVFVFLCFRKNH